MVPGRPRSLSIAIWLLSLFFATGAGVAPKLRPAPKIWGGDLAPEAPLPCTDMGDMPLAPAPSEETAATRWPVQTHSRGQTSRLKRTPRRDCPIYKIGGVLARAEFLKVSIGWPLLDCPINAHIWDSFLFLVELPEANCAGDAVVPGRPRSLSIAIWLLSLFFATGAGVAPKICTNAKLIVGPTACRRRDTRDRPGTTRSHQ